ncbi:MAG: TetR/AcrR family transcriptional regulator [Methanotrichaceae archaeon]
MGRFSNDKREEIRHNIQEVSMNLFSRYGIKKTTIDDIVRAAGIGKGTFYLFYPSKEDLIFELIQTVYRPREEFLQKLERADKVNVEDFKAALKMMIEKLAENPFLQVFYQSGDEDFIAHVISREKLEEHSKDEEYFIQTLLRIMHQKGFNPKRSPEIFNGLFHLIWISLIYRKDITKNGFDEIMDIIIDMICQQLIG